MTPYRQNLLQAVAQLEIRSRKNLASLLAGDYRSTFRGSGMHFKEFRRYEPGDDIRHMSWTVTARTRHPTIKIYEEERELNVLLMADVSGSTLFGEAGRRKIDMYAEVTSLLGLAAIKSGDPFSTLLFSDQVNSYLPPRRTQDQVRIAMIRILEGSPERRRSDLRPALTYAQKVLKARSLILVLSDFLMPDFAKELASLSRRHEVILLHGYDDAERGTGLSGVYPIWDPETQEFLILDGSSRRTRRLLAEHQTSLTNSLQSLGRACGADYLPLSVEDDYLKRMVRFFRQRSGRR